MSNFADGMVRTLASCGDLQTKSVACPMKRMGRDVMLLCFHDAVTLKNKFWNACCFLEMAPSDKMRAADFRSGRETSTLNFCSLS